MTIRSSKAAGKPLFNDEPTHRPDIESPLDRPAHNPQRAGLSEEMTTKTEAVKAAAKPAPSEATPHLLTPLAAVWPAPTRREPPKAPESTGKPTAPRMVKVTFALLEPGAKQVFLCGEFNGWAADATPLKRGDAGRWETTLALAPGRHEYKFLVDGNWKHDPLARVNVWNQNGTLNSVAQVRP